ncbi:arginine rich protein [Mycobacterium tuberculosis M2459]|nr:arginine rich protein [Mycobacterium tuberculosis M2459]
MLVDELGVKIVHAQHVPAPYLVQRMREIHERDENRQRHAQVDVQRRRDQPERGQHQHRRNRDADHHPDGRTLAGQIVAHPVSHRVRQPRPVAIADVLPRVGPRADCVVAHSLQGSPRRRERRRGQTAHQRLGRRSGNAIACPLYLENAAGPEPDTKRAEGRRFGAFGGGDLRWMADRVPRQGSGRRGLGSRSGAGVPQGADARGWRHTADGVPRVGQPAIRRGVPGFWCWLDHVLTGFGGRNAICAIEDGVEPRVAWWALCTDFDVPRSMGRRTPVG